MVYHHFPHKNCHFGVYPVSESPIYPPVIKQGNWISHMDGSFCGKSMEIHPWWIFHCHILDYKGVAQVLDLQHLPGGLWCGDVGCHWTMTVFPSFLIFLISFAMWGKHVGFTLPSEIKPQPPTSFSKTISPCFSNITWGFPTPKNSETTRECTMIFFQSPRRPETRNPRIMSGGCIFSPTILKEHMFFPFDFPYPRVIYMT